MGYTTLECRRPIELLQWAHTVQGAHECEFRDLRHRWHAINLIQHEYHHLQQHRLVFDRFPCLYIPLETRIEGHRVATQNHVPLTVLPELLAACLGGMWQDQAIVGIPVKDAVNI